MKKVLFTIVGVAAAATAAIVYCWYGIRIDMPDYLEEDWWHDPAI